MRLNNTLLTVLLAAVLAACAIPQNALMPAAANLNATRTLLTQVTPANVTYPVPQNVTEAAAAQALKRGQAVLDELAALGLGRLYVRDQLLDARNAFEGQNTAVLVAQIFSITNATEQAKFVAALNTTFTPEEIAQLLKRAPKIRYNYSRVLEDVSRIEQRRALTFEVLDQIALLNQQISRLDTAQFNFTEALEAQALIKDKFAKEQLDEIPPLITQTLDRIEQIQLETSRLRTFVKASQQNLVSFVRRHPWQVGLGTLAVILFAWITHCEVVARSLRRKVADLKTEQRVLKDLLEQAQREYYEEGKMGKSLYKIKIKRYEERQTRIKEELPVFEAELARHRGIRKYF